MPVKSDEGCALCLQANCEALMLMSGADVGQPSEGMYNGIPVEEWPRVVLSPAFAPSLAQIKVGVVLDPCRVA